MARNLQINSGVIIKQAQNNTSPVVLPNSSVNLTHLSSGARIALQGASLVVGSATEVGNGIADYSSLASAIAALSSGGKIIVRSSYTGAENVSLSANFQIEGQGHLTVLGTLTFTGDFNSVSNLKHGNVVFNAGADKNQITGTWLDSGGTVTDNGSGNDARYVEE